jgi:recombination protein RecR
MVRTPDSHSGNRGSIPRIAAKSNFLMLPDSVTNAIELFKKLPGVGKRGAQKLTIDLLESKDDVFSELITNLVTMKETVKFCETCGFFADQKLCNICSNYDRDKFKICLVEKVTDVFNIEKTGVFNGVYHVVNRLISPIDNIFIQQTNLPFLLEDRIPKLIPKLTNDQQLELVIFFKAGFSSEATITYLREYLKQKGLTQNVQTTKLAEGLPLYYNPDNLDQATMVKALEDRRAI